MNVPAFAAAIAKEEATLRDRYGIAISEDLCVHDNPCCIRRSGDLMRYADRSLDWLAKASGTNPIQEREGLEAGLAVASQVERMRRRPPSPRLFELVRQRIRTRFDD
jgi:hypothetical protein